jgi:hypothetical protein
MSSDFHANYIAHELTRRCASDSVEKLTSVLSDAQVDLNPHQIEAALFAFRNWTGRKTHCSMKLAAALSSRQLVRRYSRCAGGSNEKYDNKNKWPQSGHGGEIT